MKLSKEKWARTNIEDCCEILDNLRKPISALEREKRILNKDQKYLFPYYGATGLVGWIDEYLVDDEYVLIGEDGAPFFDKSKDIAYLIRGKSWVNNHVHILRAKENITINTFILHYLNSFNDFGGYVNGTTRLKLNQGKLKDIPVLLPTLEEQKQIASLFQTLKTVIEQVDEQEKCLLTLQRSLVDGLLEKQPHFGKILDSQNTDLIKFGKTAYCIEEHDKEKKEINRFVGLENIETGNFQIETWGNIADGTTFTKRFNSGDILFGKRRSYLKKVAVADFDGICSGDILVFRAKKEIILPELLPFYISSEAFINHAVKTSAGSLSPRTKWKDLSEFEFSLPNLDVQASVLEVLKQIQILLKQLRDHKATLKILKQNLLNEILG